MLTFEPKFQTLAILDSQWMSTHRALIVQATICKKDCWSALVGVEVAMAVGLVDVDVDVVVVIRQ